VYVISGWSMLCVLLCITGAQVGCSTQACSHDPSPRSHTGEPPHTPPLLTQSHPTNPTPPHVPQADSIAADAARSANNDLSLSTRHRTPAAVIGPPPSTSTGRRRHMSVPPAGRPPGPGDYDVTKVPTKAAGAPRLAPPAAAVVRWVRWGPGRACM
jgi:hypothetical protein